MKKQIKDTYFSIRIKKNTKVLFHKVARKRGVKVSQLILDFIAAEIKKEGVVLDEKDPNQLEIPMRNLSE
jgi:antitoxin component of RelBE/YafQ-DinJ toxin-antitoxin module